MRRLLLNAACISFGLLFLCGCGGSEAHFEIDQETTRSISQDISADSCGASDDRSGKGKIMVYICGAVPDPGVYELDAGSRVCDAVKMAGGLLPEADERLLNQAQILSDEQQIIVYTKEEDVDPAVPAYASGQGSGSQSGKININTADKESLMSIPGIGESRACDIIEYRNSNGGFSDIGEIRNISGIGDKTFEKLKEYIEV